MNPRDLIGRFIVCQRVGSRGATCEAKTALSHLMTMKPPACPMCGRHVGEDEIREAMTTTRNEP